MARLKLELGAGHRPTRGYEHNDLHPFPHIEHVGEAWMLDLPDNSVDEVLALAFIEHLTYDHALDTFRNVHRMLKPGGVFLFDVPDYPTWVRYYLRHLGNYNEAHPEGIPDLAHVKRTLFGWQRWPGDEHLYGWDRGSLFTALRATGFEWEGPDQNVEGVMRFIDRGLYRQRFYNLADAHIYMAVTK